MRRSMVKRFENFVDKFSLERNDTKNRIIVNMSI